ncbi:hypothetical protein [Nocardioides luteus]|uniref:hypothetical protein n=1 Tax=Nocardioides luteus TaxID=1844 RepID=UPI0018C8EE64|nr:hypothetical protein [Nocardioides luteus]MBG6094184.1 hypothetical protein [Nocardioides luteus]
MLTSCGSEKGEPTGPDASAPPSSSPSESPATTGGSGGTAGILDADITLAETTNELAKVSMKTLESQGYENLEQLADAKFGGVTFFHIRGKSGNRSYDQYGTVIDGSQVTVDWNFISGWPIGSRPTR